MAPPPNTSYKSLSEGWKWYSAQETRPDNAPPFTMDGVNKVFVPNGEVFCRFNMNHNTEEGVDLCPRADKQLHWANLKRHVESHHVHDGDILIPVVLEKNRTGGLTMTDHYQMTRYWNKVKQQIDEYDPLEELKPLDITPIRLRTRLPHGSKVKDLFNVPMTKTRTTKDGVKKPPHPKIPEMRLMSCPTIRKPYCELWMHFKKHPKEKEDEESDSMSTSPTDRKSVSPSAKKTLSSSTQDASHQNTSGKRLPVVIHDDLEFFEKAQEEQEQQDQQLLEKQLEGDKVGENDEGEEVGGDGESGEGN
ncbi:hypothetical protein ABKA04_000674 [Annulohypoxylon sp. FPYF3050]